MLLGQPLLNLLGALPATGLQTLLQLDQHRPLHLRGLTTAVLPAQQALHSAGL